MKELHINTNWKEKKLHLLQTFSSLKEKDLQYIEGREDELVRRIGNRLGTEDYATRKIIRLA